MSKWFAVILLVLSLAGCNSNTVQPVASPTDASAPTQAESTVTPLPPTPTPEPLALRVNGLAIPLAEYQASLQQLQAVKPEMGETEARELVVQSLVEEALLAQAAFEGGFALSDADLEQRAADMASQVGGQESLDTWMAQMGYTAESFRSALRRAAAAAWQRDQIIASVPLEMEQVRARQILLSTSQGAAEAMALAKSQGNNFTALAWGYDLVSGGDLYWFPRGYLLQPELEEAAFSLQPGEISEIIQTEIGYHILQVNAREVRPLSEDARQTLQMKALADWLEARKGSAQIETLLP